MNSTFTIIMIPLLLVTLMYVLVLRHMGYPSGYPRLIVAMAVFFGTLWWLGRRTTCKSKPGTQ